MVDVFIVYFKRYVSAFNLCMMVVSVGYDD